LDDYLFHQKKLLPFLRTSEVRFVPNLVLLSLERLEILLKSGICTALDIALAFYSPNETIYSKGEWGPHHDKNLKAFKVLMIFVAITHFSNRIKSILAILK